MQRNQYLSKTLFLLLYLLGLVFVFSKLNHSIFDGNSYDVMLFSSLSALAINIILINSFFETPKDVVASAVNILILLSALFLDAQFPKTILFFLFIYASISLLIASFAIFLYSPEQRIESLKYRTSELLKKIAIAIGSSKIIFSILIAILLIQVYSAQSLTFYILLGMFLILVASDAVRNAIISILDYIFSLFKNYETSNLNPIGCVAAVQSKEIFIVDLDDIVKRKECNLFDFVEFKYGTDSYYFKGVIIDRYYLDSIQKIKVLKTKAVKINNSNKKEFSSFQSNIVYKIENKEEDDRTFLQNFVGTIREKSNISQINFEYSNNKRLSHGDLVFISEKNKQNESVDVLYQITQAQTEIKSLENRNEIGFITATATQLGVWQHKSRNFEKFGWVPSVNTVVKLCSDDIEGPEKKENEIEIGTIENTNFKVIVNINDIVTHHTAILGTTGTGKSVFARNLIRELSLANNKVFCIDLTGEIKKFIPTVEVINNAERFNINADNKNLAQYIKQIVETRGSNYGKNPAQFDVLEQGVENHMKQNLSAFINGANNVGLFELPELSNTDETLEYTKFFFKALFNLAKEGAFQNNQACIVLEEAHTLIPEWNFVGGTDEKTARKLTNTISQIALQGRKYNVGLMIIAQRTANVSKTILTQCNTIISFKQFDNTSRDFLTNHFGEAFVASLPTLKNRRAIIAGKGLISDVPIIFKVKEINEEPINVNSANIVNANTGW